MADQDHLEMLNPPPPGAPQEDLVTMDRGSRNEKQEIYLHDFTLCSEATDLYFSHPNRGDCAMHRFHFRHGFVDDARVCYGRVKIVTYRIQRV